MPLQQDKTRSHEKLLSSRASISTTTAYKYYYVHVLEAAQAAKDEWSSEKMLSCRHAKIREM